MIFSDFYRKKGTHPNLCHTFFILVNLKKNKEMKLMEGFGGYDIYDYGITNRGKKMIITVCFAIYGKTQDIFGHKKESS